MPRAALVSAVLLVGCASSGAAGDDPPGADASGTGPDATAPGLGGGGPSGSGAGADATTDPGSASDAGSDAGSGSGSGSDAASDAASVADAGSDSASVADSGSDAGIVSDHVHILIDNFCHTSTQPGDYVVPRNQRLNLTYHNHSVDYEADVWLSYGGGYLQLAKGAEWHDRFVFCSTPLPYTAYADVSIAGGGIPACPAKRLLIHCNGHD